MYINLYISFQMSFFGCREDDKAAVLIHLLKNVIDQSEQTFVFAATKHHIEYLNMVGIQQMHCILFSLLYILTGIKT